MRFGTQQLLLIGPIVVIRMMPELAEATGRDPEAWHLPLSLEIALMTVVNLSLLRFCFWLAWTSDRGDRFFKVVGLSRAQILRGFGAPFLRWYCHIDRYGRDRDRISA